MSLEAPLYEIGTKDSKGTDAYKLKLATWVDTFQRDPNVKEAQVTTLGGKNPLDQGLIARLRLQAIWNNFSLNGSRIQIFQTLNGASSTNGLSPFYNNTLGIAGVIRLNSGDASGLKLTKNTTDIFTESTGTTSAWNTVHAGANSTLSNSSSGDCGNTATGAIVTGTGCQYIVQNRTRTDTKTSTRTWSLPGDYKDKVLRLSTQETTDTGNLLTPAINGGAAPTFKADEGLFLYNPNINLVLGPLYQPLILGTDGKNFSLEVARIPNKESIYKQIYTDYTGADSSYKGSTCNIYQCGNTLTLGGKDYQGSSATHSSISIGTVYSADAGKTLVADSSADAIGLSFGALQTTSVVTNTVTNTEVQYAQRAINNQIWRQNSKCTGSVFGNCTAVTNTNGTLTQWQYYNASNLVNSLNGWQNKPDDATLCSTSFGNGNSGCNNSSPASDSSSRTSCTGPEYSDAAPARSPPCGANRGR